MNRIYIRRSTQDQEFLRQEHILKEKYNFDECKVYEEVMSGKNRKRPMLNLMLSELNENDNVIVTDLTRLARSVKDLWEIGDSITNKKANLISLKENVDLKTSTGKLLFTMIAAIGQFEVDVLSDRTKEALAAKKASGVQLGRPKSVDEDVLNQAVDYYMTSRLSYKDAAEQFGINYVTLFNECKKRGLKRKHYKKGKL